MKKEIISTKEKILMKGAEIIHRKGFNNTGIQEILTESGVPRGSFYFHFKSKDDFGLQLIEGYKAYFSEVLSELFNNNALSPVNRIRQFLEYIVSVQRKNNFKLGCPIGNLVQEMGELNVGFSRKLNDIFVAMKMRISDCLRQAIEQNEIRQDIDPEEAADMILCYYQGTLLRLKVVEDESENQRLCDLMIKTICDNLMIKTDS